MCARSMHVAVGALGKAFAEGAGHEVEFDFGTVGVLQGKLDAGETADVLILSVPGIDKLEKAGLLVAGSRKDVARTYIAVCIREGAPAAGFRHARGVQAPPGERPRHRHQRPGGRRFGGRSPG
jgi:ABC-type molybdate transport system substrate-binding protein